MHDIKFKPRDIGGVNQRSPRHYAHFKNLNFGKKLIIQSEDPSESQSFTTSVFSGIVDADKLTATKGLDNPKPQYLGS